MDEDYLEEPEEVAPADPQSDPLTQYITSISNKKMFSAEEEYHLAVLAAQGDMGAKNKIIENYLTLVVNIAKRYSGSGVPLLDLIQEGNLGVMHAIDKFVPEKGFRFSTYASNWIKSYITLYIMNQGRTIRVPVDVLKKRNTYLRIAQSIERSTSAKPSVATIAQVAGDPVEKVQSVMDLHDWTVSLDASHPQEPTLTLMDVLSDEGQLTPQQELENTEINAMVHSWLAQLKEKHRAIIEWEYGIDHYEAKNIKAIIEKLKLHRKTFEYMRPRAFSKLKEIAFRSIDKSQATVYI